MAEIRQTDSVRLIWDDMNNRAETIFKPPTAISYAYITLNPSSLVLILKHNRLIRQLGVSRHTGHV